MKRPNPSVTCFLGAGYSFVEGVPLAKDLLRTNYVLALSEASRRRFAALRGHYEDWQQHHPGDYPEQYLGGLYMGLLGWDAPPWSLGGRIRVCCHSIGWNATCLVEPQSSILQPTQSPFEVRRSPAVLERSHGRG
jgi:hypothetical protein